MIVPRFQMNKLIMIFMGYATFKKKIIFKKKIY